MNLGFIAFDNTDKRIAYAAETLEKSGFLRVKNKSSADFVLLGVNPEKELLNYDIPIFAGNVSGENIFDYTKNEAFALKNAYLTAEGALALAIEKSEKSLINSNILITGYGRIGKALHRYLSPFSNRITVCARSAEARCVAESCGAKTLDFPKLTERNGFDFIFNTVCHPVFNQKELKALKKDVLIIDLASFPGGVDRHEAETRSINLITARGLPSRYSPKAAGEAVALAILDMTKEVFN